MIIDILGTGDDALGEVVTVVENNEEKKEEVPMGPSRATELQIVEIEKEKTSEPLPVAEIQKILDEL